LGNVRRHSVQNRPADFNAPHTVGLAPVVRPLVPVIDQNTVKAGEIAELEDKDAERLIALGKAEKAPDGVAAGVAAAAPSALSDGKDGKAPDGAPPRNEKAGGKSNGGK
jgi:hypothetical protein